MDIITKKKKESGENVVVGMMELMIVVVVQLRSVIGQFWPELSTRPLI